MLNPLTFRHFFLLPIALPPKNAKMGKMQESHPESNTHFLNLCIFYKITFFNSVVKKSLTLFVFNKIDYLCVCQTAIFIILYAI